jgi:hypothetical protein
MTDLETRLAADLADAARRADLRTPAREAVAVTVARRRHRRRVRTTVLAVAATVLVVAAAVATVGALRDDDHTMIDEPPAPTTTTTVPPTTAPVVTASTIVLYPGDPNATPTTSGEGSSPPVSTNLVLRPDGIGPFDFGAPEDEVVAAVTAELGDPRGHFPGGGNRGCQPEAEDVAWIGLILTFEGPDAGSMRLTAWSAGLGDNPQQRRNYRMEDGPTLGDPVPVWQAAYGSRFSLALLDSQFPSVTIRFPGATVEGTAGPDEPLVVDSLWRRTTDCVLGD